VNTVFLFIFLRKNPSITLGRTLGSALAYALKMALLSAAALIPVLLLNPRLEPLFRGRSRLLAQGLPLLISALVYGLLGIGLLAATKDSQLRALIRMFRGKRGI
jgi:putative peptidoglycan lipid II flippase